MARPASKSTSAAGKSRAGTRKTAAPKTVARPAAKSSRGAAKTAVRTASRKAPAKQAEPSAAKTPAKPRRSPTAKPGPPTSSSRAKGKS